MSPPPQEPPRLSEQGDEPLSRLLTAAKAGADEGRPGARERVWRKLAVAMPGAKRAGWPVLVLAAAVCAALGLTMWWERRPADTSSKATVVWISGTVEAAGRPAGIGTRLEPGTVVRTAEDSRVFVRLPVAGAMLGENARARFNGSTLQLEAGSLALVVVPQAAAQVQAEDSAVDVNGSVALVKVAPGRVVSVWAYEGSARVRGPRGEVQLAQGEGWANQPADPKTKLEGDDFELIQALASVSLREGPVSVSEPVEPAVSKSPQADVLAPVPVAEAPRRQKPSDDRQPASHEMAQALLHQNRFHEALTHYEALAMGSGPWAESSLYEVGRLKLRSLSDPNGALQAFKEYQRRYPQGVLIQEAALSLIEAHLMTGDMDLATQTIDAFESTFPSSERLGDVRLLRANARRDNGDCARALVDYQVLITHARFADDALYFTAYCQQQTGREDEARRSLGEYLELFPGGRHASEARSALGIR